ncbi:hypothetical protein [Clostridium tyrobutyricum]|nr:hypothetical protein [Clostridium tyrobutyricum]
MVILGVVKDIITITVGILSSYKILLEIKKLKDPKKKSWSHRHKK